LLIAPRITLSGQHQLCSDFVTAKISFSRRFGSALHRRDFCNRAPVVFPRFTFQSIDVELERGGFDMRFFTRILLLSVSLTATFVYAQNLPTFQHIIVVIQENRTPDNLFGSNPTFVPGVDIQQPSSGQWCLGACFDPGHRHPDWENEYNKVGTCPGSSNAGACTSKSTYCNAELVGPGEDELHVPQCPQQSYVSGTYDGAVVSPYFDIATKYGFAYYFFQTNQGPSMPAHQFLFTGTSAPTGDPTQGGYNFFQAENPTSNMDNTACTAPPGQTVQLIDPSGNEKQGSQYNVYPCFLHNTLSTLLEASVGAAT
jgi:phospholipase C